jgi:hypothetical protein
MSGPSLNNENQHFVNLQKYVRAISEQLKTPGESSKICPGHLSTIKTSTL